MVNEFHTSWSEKRDRAAVAGVLNRLIQCGQRHFQNEEAIKEAVQYPLLEAHREIHEELVPTFSNSTRNLPNATTCWTTTSVNFSSIGWWTTLSTATMTFANFWPAKATKLSLDKRGYVPGLWRGRAPGRPL